MQADEERVLRIPLPVGLIRRMDELVRRRVGGFESRAELVQEAVEAMVLELAYDKAPELVEPMTPLERAQWHEEADRLGAEGRRGVPELEERYPTTGGLGFAAPALTKSDGRASANERLRAQLQRYALGYADRGAVVHAPVGIARREPMFGLHNRDYPSLWAAMRIAGLTRDGAASQEQLRRDILDDAWAIGAELQAMDPGGRRKLSALFPTNREKRPSAEDAFMNFAVGTATLRGGEVHVSGPLFLWHAVGVEQGQGEEESISLGLTAEGYELLDAVRGLTPDLPHTEELANPFFEHLMRHADADWWGFRTLLSAVGPGIGRGELVAVFHDSLQRDFPREASLEPWTDVQAATNTAGYVARAREWGLLELKQFRGLYLLTDFGREILERQSD